jgi:hypothetical protein
MNYIAPPKAQRYQKGGRKPLSYFSMGSLDQKEKTDQQAGNF